MDHTPFTFILWLNGASAMIEQAPTPEQWAEMTQRLSEVVGSIAADKLLRREEVRQALSGDSWAALHKSMADTPLPMSSPFPTHNTFVTKAR